MSAELLGEFAAVECDVDGDDARTHDHGELRRRLAIVSPPCRLSRLSAPQAVPVPQDIAAPVTKESASGSGTSVDTVTFI
jgi:hypothetical protein